MAPELETLVLPAVWKTCSSLWSRPCGTFISLHGADRQHPWGPVPLAHPRGATGLWVGEVDGCEVVVPTGMLPTLLPQLQPLWFRWWDSGALYGCSSAAKELTEKS